MKNHIIDNKYIEQAYNKQCYIDPCSTLTCAVERHTGLRTMVTRMVMVIAGAAALSLSACSPEAPGPNGKISDNPDVGSSSSFVVANSNGQANVVTPGSAMSLVSKSLVSLGADSDSIVTVSTSRPGQKNDPLTTTTYALVNAESAPPQDVDPSVCHEKPEATTVEDIQFFSESVVGFATNQGSCVGGVLQVNLTVNNPAGDTIVEEEKTYIVQDDDFNPLSDDGRCVVQLYASSQGADCDVDAEDSCIRFSSSLKVGTLGRATIKDKEELRAPLFGEAVGLPKNSEDISIYILEARASGWGGEDLNAALDTLVERAPPAEQEQVRAQHLLRACSDANGRLVTCGADGKPTNNILVPLVSSAHPIVRETESNKIYKYDIVIDFNSDGILDESSVDGEVYKDCVSNSTTDGSPAIPSLTIQQSPSVTNAKENLAGIKFHRNNINTYKELLDDAVVETQEHKDLLNNAKICVEEELLRHDGTPKGSITTGSDEGKCDRSTNPVHGFVPCAEEAFDQDFGFLINADYADNDLYETSKSSFIKAQGCYNTLLDEIPALKDQLETNPKDIVDDLTIAHKVTNMTNVKCIPIGEKKNDDDTVTYFIDTNGNGIDEGESIPVGVNPSLGLNDSEGTHGVGTQMIVCNNPPSIAAFRREIARRVCDMSLTNMAALRARLKNNECANPDMLKESANRAAADEKADKIVAAIGQNGGPNLSEWRWDYIFNNPTATDNPLYVPGSSSACKDDGIKNEFGRINIPDNLISNKTLQTAQKTCTNMPPVNIIFPNNFFDGWGDGDSPGEDIKCWAIFDFGDHMFFDEGSEGDNFYDPGCDLIDASVVVNHEHVLNADELKEHADGPENSGFILSKDCDKVKETYPLSSGNRFK